MDLVKLSYSRVGPYIGMMLVRILPKGTAYKIADFLARRTAANKESPMVQAIRVNQAVVRGKRIEDPSLEQDVVEVLQTNLRGFIELFRIMQAGDQAIKERSVISDNIRNPALELLDAGKGVFLAGCHTAGFDQLLLALDGIGLPNLLLSYRDPTGSYVVQNEIRRRYGANIHPISSASLRQSISLLKQGGIVVTAVDRPDPGGAPMEFFGREARLPLGHARMALKADAPMMVVGSQKIRKGHYRADCLDLFQPEYAGADEHESARILAQKVLGVLEDFIRERPGQWLMFHPVWPDLLQ